MPILCLLTAGCDPYAGRRPFGLGAAAWTCQEGDDVFRFKSVSFVMHIDKTEGDFFEGVGDELTFIRTDPVASELANTSDSAA